MEFSEPVVSSNDRDEEEYVWYGVDDRGLALTIIGAVVEDDVLLIFHCSTHTPGEATMTKRYIDGGDVDLDVEVVHRKDGTRLTEADAEAWAHEIKLRAGRPSLSSGHKHSPQVSARLPENLLERLRRRAEAEGKPASEIVREALERYI